jgi:hypothetical protein
MMTLAASSEDVDYGPIDAVLTSWSESHNIKFEKRSKGYAVRSFWIESKIQLWINAPDVEGYVRLHLAELKTELPSKWGRSIEWRTTDQELSSCLENLWDLGHKWLR